MDRRSLWHGAWGLLLALAMTGPASGAPYVPDDDAAVLERLPEKSDPALKSLKRMRTAIAAEPRNLDAAARFARRAIDAARATGDPRFFGQAQSALAPWWSAADAPAPALLLRATIKQSQHDFDGALADLDRLLAADPGAAQARITRATVRTVVGRYADALADCRALAGITARIVVAGCAATPLSLSGDPQAAYDVLAQALSQPGVDLALREWGLTLAAEIAERRGDAAGAEQHYRMALALDRRDAYLQGAYGDFLLAADRPADALAVIGDDLRNDTLLLRRVLAEERLADRREAFVAHRDEMAARFDAARRSGDSVHRREEARFRLLALKDAAGAVALARENWKVQREPADLRILVQAARAANDPAALALAQDWIARTHLDDRTLVAAMAGAR